MGRLDAEIREAEQAALTAAEGSDERRVAEARAATLKDLDSKGYGFTQKDLDKHAGTARGEGRDSGLSEFLKEFEGVDSPAALKAAYQEYRTIQEATETETEREKKAREKAETERDQEREGKEAALKLADERAIKADLKVALIDAGARKDKLSKLLREADLSSVEIENDEVKGVESVLEKLKADEADWFGTETTRVPRTPDGKERPTKSAGQSYMDRKYARDKRDK